MAKAGDFAGDVDIAGTLRVKKFVPPDACLDEDALAGNAVWPAANTTMRLNKTHGQANVTATAETRVAHSAFKGGVVAGFAAGSIVAATGNSTVTIDLKKNGTSVLSAPIVLASTNTAYVPVTAIISTTAYNADETFTIVQTVSAGTGTLQTGVFWRPVFEEKPF